VKHKDNYKANKKDSSTDGTYNNYSKNAVVIVVGFSSFEVLA
jgi:hypothetical protein